MSWVYENDEDLSMLKDAFFELSTLFGSSSNQGIQMLHNLKNLMKSHFDHQSQIVTQSMYPFLTNIAESEKRYLSFLQEFLKSREELKDKVHGVSGLQSLERSLKSEVEPQLTSP
jgi:hypothetical protein